MHYPHDRTVGLNDVRDVRLRAIISVFAAELLNTTEKEKPVHHVLGTTDVAIFVISPI